MEKNYLYPGDSVKPIMVGDGYRDYLLTELLRDIASCITVVVSSVNVFGLDDCYEWQAMISFFPNEGWDSKCMLSVMIFGDSYYTEEYVEPDEYLTDLVVRIYDNAEDGLSVDEFPHKHKVRRITFVKIIY